MGCVLACRRASFGVGWVWVCMDVRAWSRGMTNYLLPWGAPVYLKFHLMSRKWKFPSLGNTLIKNGLDLQVYFVLIVSVRGVVDDDELALVTWALMNFGGDRPGSGHMSRLFAPVGMHGSPEDVKIMQCLSARLYAQGNFPLMHMLLLPAGTCWELHPVFTG